ncbi:type I-C CRISPR-associated protein Cas5c [Glycomyces sp. TRM65418]|nr:type I-C CRISPR-associated protein Cas5c [Glycomyces sp. TRM65418]MCC3764464.1 type I-C CRISPR-associated protein Cas5c [Glycomyces sp. TRM65418]QZD54137.1 type I-C CRISPR-associated protein Cas5c [Glycomyces sp. TRM65418]
MRPNQAVVDRDPEPLVLDPGPDRQPALVVQVWGEGALFTRPDMKTERLTYDAMTPSAAKGVLEAIYWKPEVRYEIAAIEVLAPIKQFEIRRNETSDLPPLFEAAKGTRRVDTAASRDQRNALCLREVKYRIHAHLVRLPHADKPIAAYRDQLRRRVDRGACFAQPYLGTREFTAYFGNADDEQRIMDSRDLGTMPLRVDYQTGRTEWFTARLERGVLRVPARGIALPAGQVP